MGKKSKTSLRFPLQKGVVVLKRVVLFMKFVGFFKKKGPSLLIVFNVHWPVATNQFISIYFIFLQEHYLFTDHVWTSCSKTRS